MIFYQSELIRFLFRAQSVYTMYIKHYSIILLRTKYTNVFIDIEFSSSISQCNN